MDPLLMIDARLSRLETKVDDLLDRMTRIEERARARAGMWGLMGGALPSIGVFIYWLVAG